MSSIAGVDALRGGRAWRLAAHAPVTIQTALPCACAFVLRAPDASAVATGVARPGAPCKITSADPRVPLALELTPLMPDGSPAGTCASAVPLRGGGPVARPTLGRSLIQATIHEDSDEDDDDEDDPMGAGRDGQTVRARGAFDDDDATADDDRAGPKGAQEDYY